MSTTVTQDMSFLHLITGASVLVQLVMLILVMISLLSWWYIFRKLFVIRNEIKKTDEFEDVFWRGADLNGLYQRTTNSRYMSGSMERIFAAGFSEFNKHPIGSDLDAVMESTRRAMRATYQREMDYLESHLSFLATVGSVSPYIGLLGTVWGIMNSFRSLSSVTQATIAHVAPGIAEALIATAVGLGGAIIAAMAFNFFTSRVEQFVVDMNDVSSEFIDYVLREGR